MANSPCFPFSRDSLRVFSSLCHIFSEENNYSQSRGLLAQVRPSCLVSLANLGPALPYISLFFPHQEVKLQAPLEPHSKKTPRPGSRGGVCDWWRCL